MGQVGLLNPAFQVGENGHDGVAAVGRGETAIASDCIMVTESTKISAYQCYTGAVTLCRVKPFLIMKFGPTLESCSY